MKSSNTKIIANGDASYPGCLIRLKRYKILDELENVHVETIEVKNRHFSNRELLNFLCSDVVSAKLSSKNLTLAQSLDEPHGPRTETLFGFKNKDENIGCIFIRNDGYSDTKTIQIETSQLNYNSFMRGLLCEFINGLTVMNTITWAYMSDGRRITMQAKIKPFKPIFQELYPFIPNLDSFIDEFIQSDSPILILNGPKGTGKSSLIKHIIVNHDRKTIISYDKDLLKSDSFYSDFISGKPYDSDYDDLIIEAEGNNTVFGKNDDLLVLEDADLLLFKRIDLENDMMSKLLNVSDGIVDIQKKKIIFTANLDNTDKIDTAILRPGRCFSLINFRELTMDEANIVRGKLGKPEFTNKNKIYSLATIFN